MSYFRNLNPYEIHKRLVNEYLLANKGATRGLARDASRDKRDADVVRENHRFLWDDPAADSWEKRLAKRYYDKLFKEYCICDLSKYKENRVALRWRIESEVVSGKGQFVCGNKTCSQKDALRSWEVNFAYVEENIKKNALVKVRLCPECSVKLNYHKKKREIKRLKRGDKHKDKKSTSDDRRTSPERDEPEVSASKDVKETAPVKEIDAWKKTVEVEEKSREEEFESYLEDLLL